MPQPWPRPAVVTREVYKAQVEARITGHDGTTFNEVLAVSLIGIMAVLLVRAANRFFDAIHFGVPVRRFSPQSVSKSTSAPAKPSVFARAAARLSHHLSLQYLVRRCAEFTLLVGPNVLAVTRETEDDTFSILIVTGVVAGLATIFSQQCCAPSDLEPYVDIASAPATASQLESAGNGNGVGKKKKRPHAAFFTDFRGSLLLLTVIAILAVDFPPFALRFMKTETFGISLMDIGVGGFVFSAGFAIGGKFTAGTPMGFSTQWLGSAVPLLLVGGFRFASVWATDYQEHVTEYGKHWNFFVTLASLPVLFVLLDLALLQPITALLRMFDGGKSSAHDEKKSPDATTDGSHQMMSTVQLCISAVRRPGLVGAVLLACHQYALSNLGVTEWIMGPQRRNFFEANKEGIVSTAGYLSLYLLAVEAGCIVLSSPSAAQSTVPFAALLSRLFGSAQSTNGRRRSLGATGPKAEAPRGYALSALVFTAALGAASMMTAIYCHDAVQPASRRMCNLTYVLFSFGVALFPLSLLGVIETCISKLDAPVIIARARRALAKSRPKPAPQGRTAGLDATAAQEKLSKKAERRLTSPDGSNKHKQRQQEGGRRRGKQRSYNTDAAAFSVESSDEDQSAVATFISNLGHKPERLTFTRKYALSTILGCVNSNQFFLFLFSNICTGAVNLTMYTIYQSPEVSYAVVGAYVAVVSSVAVLLHDVFNVQLKMW